MTSAQSSVYKQIAVSAILLHREKEQHKGGRGYFVWTRSEQYR